METHNPSSAIRVSSVKRLATIRDLVQTYADGAGIPDPEAFANQLQIVTWGSIVAAVDGRRESATQARRLANLLVEQALP